MYKRILVLFLVALTLIFSIPFTAFAETETQGIVWKDLDKTTIKEDLGDYDFSEYKISSVVLNPSIIAVAEQGFSANMDYEKCALYLYLYIPMINDISLSSNLNKVQIKNGNVYSKYNLIYVGKEGEAVVKYKVDLPTSFFKQQNTKTRTYDISAIELCYKQTPATPKDYTIGGTYIFEGLDENVALKSVETFEVVHLDINYTTFRNTSDVDYRNQLTSVYFSIPDYLEEKYNGKLYGIDCTYEKYYTKPMVVTRSQAVSDSLSALKSDSLLPYRDNDEIDVYYYNPDVKVRLYNLKTRENGSGTYTTDTYKFAFNVNLSSELENSFYSFMFTEDFQNPYYIPFVFYKNSQFDSDFWIDKNEVLGKINNAYLTADKDKHYLISGLDYYHKWFFEDYYLLQDGTKVPVSVANSKKTEAITFDDEPFNMVSYDDTHNWWQTFLDFGFKLWFVDLKNDETYKDIQPISAIKSEDYMGLTSEEFSKKYYVDKNEVSGVMSDVAYGEARDKTTYIFRLDVAPYRAFSVDAYAEGATGQNMDTFVCQMPVYMGFDVLDLLFKDENGEIVTVAVSSDPENLVGGLEPDLEQTVDGDFEKWKKELLDKLRSIFKIFLLVVSCLLIIYIAPYVKKAIVSFVDGLSSALHVSEKDNKSKKQRRKRNKRR